MEFYLFSSLHLPLFLPLDIVVKNVKRRCYLLLIHNFASFIFNFPLLSTVVYVTIPRSIVCGGALNPASYSNI